jgi:hypothetical protein
VSLQRLSFLHSWYFQVDMFHLHLLCESIDFVRRVTVPGMFDAFGFRSMCRWAKATMTSNHVCARRANLSSMHASPILWSCSKKAFKSISSVLKLFC